MKQSSATHKILTVCLFLSTALIAGCLRHTDRRVREVTMTLEDSDRGSFRSEVIIFRRERGAERHVKITGPNGKLELDEDDAGPMASDTFERLVRAIEENDFYSKRDQNRAAFNGEDLTNITVLTDNGSYSLNVEHQHRDPQLQSVQNAIRMAESEIHWQPASRRQ